MVCAFSVTACFNCFIGCYSNSSLIVWLTSILIFCLSETSMVEALNLADGNLWHVQMVYPDMNLHI